MYLCVAIQKTTINGYVIGQGEIVEVEFINIEIGKRTTITFKDRLGTRFSVDAKFFYERFKLDTILER